MSAIKSIAKLKRITRQKVEEVIYLQMLKLAEGLLSDAVAKKKYRNLTGNTLTSLSVGLYKNKQIATIMNVREVLGLKDPTRPTISSTGGYYEFNMYDSGRRKVLWGRLLASNFIETDEEFGYDRAMRILQEYTPKNSFAVVICTGTEYSSYLEEVKGLNVLTETLQNAGSILLENLVKI